MKIKSRRWLDLDVLSFTCSLSFVVLIYVTPILLHEIAVIIRNNIPWPLKAENKREKKNHKVEENQLRVCVCVYIYIAFTDSACFGLCLLVAVYRGLASEQQDMSRRQVLTHTTGHLVN